ncbi:unnamed protein product [Amaranthus hypochondriacus]
MTALVHHHRNFLLPSSPFLLVLTLCHFIKGRLNFYWMIFVTFSRAVTLPARTSLIDITGDGAPMHCIRGMSENVEACDVTFILTLDVVSLYLNLFMFVV